MLGDGFSDPIYADQAALPRDGFATLMLKMLLLAPLDKLRESHPTVSLTVVVDDIIVERTSGLQCTVREVPDAAFRLKTLLDDVELQASPKKPRAPANPPSRQSWPGPAAA